VPSTVPIRGPEQAVNGRYGLPVGSDPPRHRHLGPFVQLLTPRLEGVLNSSYRPSFQACGRGSRSAAQNPGVPMGKDRGPGPVLQIGILRPADPDADPVRDDPERSRLAGQLSDNPIHALRDVVALGVQGPHQAGKRHGSGGCPLENDFDTPRRTLHHALPFRPWVFEGSSHHRQYHPVGRAAPWSVGTEDGAPTPAIAPRGVDSP